MFLTKKELRKIRIMTSLYIFLGIFCLIFHFLLEWLQTDDRFLLILGLFCLCFSIAVYISGKYAEGKGKLLSSGNKLVSYQLRPEEFIRLYEQKRDCPDNVISKPDFDILALLVAAYDALGEDDKSIETADQMISITSDSKKLRAKLLKASLLYSTKRIDEANMIYDEVQNQKMNLITKGVLDIVFKTDRALALGDYSTAEAYIKQHLDNKFLKSTPLEILSDHFNLAIIYIKIGKISEAKIHLNYCIENGGETALKTKAAEMLLSFT